MWVISVFSSDRRKPMVDKTSATSGSSASVCALVPETRMTKSSAYAERGVMPTAVWWCWSLAVAEGGWSA